MKKLRVGVIFGGRSGEHDVSILSSKEVIAAIDASKYEVIPIGIDKEGRWFQTSPELLATAHTRQCPSFLLPEPGTRNFISLSKDGLINYLKELDVIFPLIHGSYGEDGCLQGLLELASIPYVGSGVLGSAVGMDKVMMKQLFRSVGLPVTDFISTTRYEWQKNPTAIQAKIESQLSYPLFIKPANLGSSVGISKVKTPKELAPAINMALAYDRKAIIENAVPHAREIEIAILGNENPKASVAGEIFPAREFYDYTAKYLDEKTALQIPAEIPDDLLAKMQEFAIQAFTSLGCEGLSRIDFLVNSKTLDVFVSEINTLPGFTQVSMYPKMWEKSGIPYTQLIDKLLQLALERHEDIKKNLTHFTAHTNSNALDTEKM